MIVKIGDDVTISGKVERIANDRIMFRSQRSVVWVEPGDIKTVRPGKEEKDGVRQ